ncbi:MAG TPA: pilus assembly protein PilP [Archangium sp.]
MKPSFAALSLGVLLSGCAQRAPEPSPRPAVPRTVAAVQAPAPTVTAVADAVSTYTYVPASKRDPFRAGFELPPAPPPPLNCDEPLCRYSLDELKLTGIVSGMGSPVAVLESPRGKGYSVYRGSKVGRYGVVKQVLRDAVVVVESWPDPRGVARKEEIVLRMRADAPLELGE